MTDISEPFSGMTDDQVLEWWNLVMRSGEIVFPNVPLEMTNSFSSSKELDGD